MITVPIGSLNLTDNIMDLITGKNNVALLNPWFALPGLVAPDSMKFLEPTIKGSYTSFEELPKIIIRGGDKNFIERYTLTDDSGETLPSTRITFSDLNVQNATPVSKYSQFKQLQKLPVSRGMMGENTTNFNYRECVLNYQLMQALEFCMIAKFMGINFVKSDGKTLILTDKDFIDEIINKIKSVLSYDISGMLYQYLQIPKNNTYYTIKTDKLKTHLNTNLKLRDKYKDVKNDLLNLLKHCLIENLTSFTTNGSWGSIFAGFNARTAIYASLNYQSSKIFTSCRGSYDVTYKPTENVGTTHRCKECPKSTLLTPTDYQGFVGKPMEAKIFMRMDFDIRIYITDNVANQNVSRTRYIVYAFVHRPAKLGVTVNIDDVPFDVENEQTDMSGVSGVNSVPINEDTTEEILI